jgi:hypothetical protein
MIATNITQRSAYAHYLMLELLVEVKSRRCLRHATCYSWKLRSYRSTVHVHCGRVRPHTPSMGLSMAGNNVNYRLRICPCWLQMRSVFS